ncbi:MAG: penicillin-binding protein 1B [Gammaproteobacteria bacterium]|nr:penicillin-binding protein 1B [Gammaproteobacteria bacterium]
MVKKSTPAKGRKKSPVKKRRKSRGKKRAARTASKSSFISMLLGLLFLFALGGAVYMAYLDQTVKSKFEGKRWAVPARIYGRALELYPGAPITQKQFQAELQQLGYRKAATAKQPGTWSQDRGRHVVHTREFDFWDGRKSGTVLDLRFSRNGLKSILDRKGRKQALARMEAPQIGSIYPTHKEDRVLVQRSDLPKMLVLALMEVEDRTFNTHHGVDPKAILRAMWANLTAGRVVQGGSTLTQQLVKNFYLTSERTLWRKGNEALMALLLDARYSKDEILEAYANEIYLGQDGSRAIHGFGLASHFYFRRPLQELDLPRLALLVALVRGPSYYDPYRHPKRAKKRRDLVLDILHTRGVISKKQRQAAVGSGLGISKKGRKVGGSYHAFLDLVRRQLQRDYRQEDLTSEGLRVFTTLDPWAQKQAELAMSQRLTRLEKGRKLPRGKLEGAAIIAGVEAGEVLAVVGGRDPSVAGFNRALDAIRPIGSLVKPAVYLTALMQPRRYNLLTPLEDESISIKQPGGKRWTPSNYDGKSHGEVPLHEALTKSYNLATVRLGMDLGLGKVAKTLRALGVERPVDLFPSMLLGAVSLSPIEVVQFYQAIAAGGFRSPLRAIREVLTADGDTLQRYPLTVKQAVPAGPAYLLNWNLQQVVQQGTARRLAKYFRPEQKIAGKTGTTNDLRDSWFAGFSADKVAVVWVGRDDNKSAGLTGSSGALEVWGDMMGRVSLAPGGQMQPEQVVRVLVDKNSGLRAGKKCRAAEIYPFIMGTEPTRNAPCASGGVGQFLRGLFE